MAISYDVLNKENFSISNLIQVFLILVSVFLLFNYKYCNSTKALFPVYIYFSKYLGHIYTNFLLSILLLSGDVEMNPGRKLISKESFSICHWNFNSITANNYTEVLLLKAYIAVHKFHIIQACQLCKVTNLEIWQKTFKNLEIK